MSKQIFRTTVMLTFKLEKDGNKYHAFCPELRGCHTFGENPEEALKNLKNAVSLYLDDLINEAEKNVQNN